MVMFTNKSIAGNEERLIRRRSLGEPRCDLLVATFQLPSSGCHLPER